MQHGQIEIALTGDVMLGRGVDQALTGRPPEWPWTDVRDLLRGADLTLVNLESPIAASGEPCRETHRVFHFRAGPHGIDALRAAGVDCVNLANNHALDYGTAALLETLERLDEAGIAHVGAGATAREASRPVVLERRGVRVGILGVCDDPPEYEATDREAGTHRIDLDDRGPDRIRERIRELERECDAVVLTIHWGPNMRLEPTERFQSFARSIVDAGAAIFHGHSAHVFQGIEWRDGHLILYDTGDFLDDYAVDPRLRNDWGLFCAATVQPGTVERLEVTPVFLEFARTRRARSGEPDEIRDRLESLCRPFGSSVQGEEPPWRVEPGPRPETPAGGSAGSKR